MGYTVLATGASSGFGLLISQALAKAGHVVYASMRDIEGRNAPQATAIAAEASSAGVALHSLELEVHSDASANAAVDRIVTKQGKLDVVVHNAGHMVLGPAEAFTSEQVAALDDVNVVGTQRVNRAALPVKRAAGIRLASVGWQQQRGRWHAAITGALYCRQGRQGRLGGPHAEC